MYMSMRATASRASMNFCLQPASRYVLRSWREYRCRKMRRLQQQAFEGQ